MPGAIDFTKFHFIFPRQLVPFALVKSLATELQPAQRDCPLGPAALVQVSLSHLPFGEADEFHPVPSLSLVLNFTTELRVDEICPG